MSGLALGFGVWGRVTTSTAPNLDMQSGILRYVAIVSQEWSLG